MTNNNIAISFENVSKLYRLGLVGTGTLSQDLNRWWKMSVLKQEDPYLKIGQTNDRATKGTSDFVFALQNINLQVEQGDVVGIIGKNGAGKSTLLKLLTRITAPSTGVIKRRGRLASLLEVGTGFHYELTGRENIYMNGSIMGMTRAEITRKLDSIIDFAGVERYIDTPIKRYSSGMSVRLGFAVAAFLEPEILIVDEVLAVGDAEFQKKAIGKMKDVAKGSGRTVLFVSHNMIAVKSLCHNGIILENGMIKETGDIETVVSHYLNGESAIENHRKWHTTPEYKKEGFELLEIGIRKTGGNYEDVITQDDELEYFVRYRLTRNFNYFWLTSHFKNSQGNAIFSSTGVSQLNGNHKEGEYIQTCKIPANFLNWGRYAINLMAFYDNVQMLCNAHDIISFVVSGRNLQLGQWMGREPGDVTPQFDYSESKVE